MESFQSKLFDQGYLELDAVADRRSAGLDLLYMRCVALGREWFVLEGVPSRRSLTVLPNGQSGGFSITAGALAAHHDNECEGQILIVQIDDIEHSKGAVGLETVKRISARLHEIISDAFVDVYGSSEKFSGGSPDMFVNDIQFIISTSNE
ncbi:MAG: hypothetical protein Q7T86_11800 [Hyphomicrobiaceae bacterium]|nr:hypothetical protein [Hyphomicrobiaceae bacterium]